MNHVYPKVHETTHFFSDSASAEILVSRDIYAPQIGTIVGDVEGFPGLCWLKTEIRSFGRSGRGFSVSFRPTPEFPANYAQGWFPEGNIRNVQEYGPMVIKHCCGHVVDYGVIPGWADDGEAPPQSWKDMRCDECEDLHHAPRQYSVVEQRRESGEWAGDR